MLGDKGLIQNVRPASAEVTGQQRELFAFDAFEYEDPNKNDPAKITVKEGWKLNLQRAVIGDTDLSTEGGFLNLDLINVNEIFAQDITATGTITGATIIGGTISIGGTPGSPNFFVDSDGNMEAVEGTFGGAVDLGTADFTTTGNINVDNLTSNTVTTGRVDPVNFVGMVAAFARNNPPPGWLKANGQAISRSTFADLFAAIGTTFGAGNGSTTFNVPDLRGEFVRGWDDGRGVDSGRSFGTAQADELRSHDHQSAFPSDFQLFLDTGFAGPLATDVTFIDTTSTGGDETRPRNIALLYCIKF